MSAKRKEKNDTAGFYTEKSGIAVGHYEQRRTMFNYFNKSKSPIVIDIYWIDLKTGIKVNETEVQNSTYRKQ